jgi:hypothetical protein
VARLNRLKGSSIVAVSTSLAPRGRDIDPVVPACAHCGGWTHRAGTVLRQCASGHLTRITMTKRYRNEAGRGPCLYFDWTTSRATAADLATQPRPMEVNARESHAAEDACA